MRVVVAVAVFGRRGWGGYGRGCRGKDNWNRVWNEFVHRDHLFLGGGIRRTGRILLLPLLSFPPNLVLLKFNLFLKVHPCRMVWSYAKLEFTGLTTGPETSVVKLVMGVGSNAMG